MRTAYVFFTLIILSTSGYPLSGLAGGVILSERTLWNYPEVILESSSEAPQKQSTELLTSSLFEPYKTDIKVIPGGSKKNQRPQLQRYDSQGLSSDEEDYDLDSQQAEPFFRDPHFEDLNSRLNAALNKLDNWLKKHPDTVLVLELDIDGVMIHFLAPPTLGKPFSIPEDQQKILDKLDTFIRQHPNIYLFYNTARPDLSFERPVADHASETTRRHWFSLRRIQKDQNSLGTIQAKADGPYGDTITYKLPAAKAIITGGGGHIEFASESFATDQDLIEINAALDQWRKDDLIALPDVLSSYVISEHYRRSGSERMLPILLSPRTNSSPLVTGPFNTLPMMQFIKLYDQKMEEAFFYSFNGVALNKGTAARLLLSLLHKKQFLKGKKGLLVAAGDSFYDAPMINPVFEAATLEVVTWDQMTARENRIRSDIVSTEVPQLPPATNFLLEGDLVWLLGVKVCSLNERNYNLCNLTNPALNQTLSNPKIVTAKGLELDLTVNLFEKITDALNQYQATSAL
ncbi:hypothetical protein NX722_16150 [Endozoicomonas gorgoniicola]|uniref:Uncharacterized protein n=1 Tax=Endozoicomonas gorgoniicola TaxID=1234144 RepID=A0ABT3MXK5_9GAMM|nr:hypothetical protein [Endozoicomonas gorgoniicola]MCW7554123.1 hypothetical protein [Endozoicomonas gorgoniicola]